MSIVLFIDFSYLESFLDIHTQIRINVNLKKYKYTPFIMCFVSQEYLKFNIERLLFMR